MVCKNTFLSVLVLAFFITAALPVSAFGNSEEKKQEIQSAFNHIPDTSQNSYVDIEVLRESGAYASVFEDNGKFWLIAFGASWCPACQKELPKLESIKRSFPKDLNMVFIFVQEDQAHIKSFIEENKYTIPYALDLSGLSASKNKIEAYPTAYLLYPDGSTVFRSVGLLDWTSARNINAIKGAISLWKE